MDTCNAPSNANIFMARLEERLLAQCSYTLPLYLRYINDIFFVFLYPKQELAKFMTYVNNAHPTIKFTEEHSQMEVVFLNTIVKKLGNKLYTDLNTKTDRYTQLPFLYKRTLVACHQNGTFRQYLRLRRNCQFDNDFNHHVDEITKHYLARKCPQQLLHDSKASKIPQHDLAPSWLPSIIASKYPNMIWPHHGYPVS